MARSVPNPDSDSLKHRFRVDEEKTARRILPKRKSVRQILPHEWKFLPSQARQIIPLCRKQAAVFSEILAREMWLTKSSRCGHAAQTERAALARRSSHFETKDLSRSGTGTGWSGAPDWRSPGPGCPAAA